MAAVIGGGPAGLIAAETLAAAGIKVTLYDRMPSVGRKFLMAGRGGLNLTHSETLDRFLPRYGRAEASLTAAIAAFTPGALRAWCEGLGQPTFVGSSGRIFPKAMKASPLLRAWLARLGGLGVRIAPRHLWTGWDESGALCFTAAKSRAVAVRPGATILALGGASWPRLGSDGSWAAILRARGVAVSDLRPANCGFVVGWSEHFRGRFAGTPLKRIALTFRGESVRGEAMVSERGIEGGAVYALSAAIRDAIAEGRDAVVHIDLRPDATAAELTRRLSAPRERQSLANFLRKTVGLAPVAIALLHETKDAALPAMPEALARRIKAVPLRLVAPFGIERAISSAGGVPFAELDESLMLRRLPGVFAAGEMLDWEAPTGGYLLQACFATGVLAARGALRWLAGTKTP
ncbi:MAG TPA: TIGR03862 family flavoprotein [Alphaproteobacteria bacterium]